MFSPMEQFIIFPVFSLQLTISNIVFYLLLSGLITLVLGSLNKGTILTNNWGIVSESLFRTVLNMLETFVGPKASIYLPLFYSLSQIILFSNLLGLVPYSSTPTVEIVMTLSLAFTLLIGFALLGFLTHKFYLLSMFLPAGTPLGLIPLMVALEVIAYLSRTLSLGLRLAINLITGHILAKVVAGFLWLGYINSTSILVLSFGVVLLAVFFCLEVLVAYLQCYIFLFIALLTLKDVSLTH
jgi:F-type H+-transporting ATPase subunit a